VVLFLGFIAFAYFAGWFASSSFQIAFWIAAAAIVLFLTGVGLWLWATEAPRSFTFAVTAVVMLGAVIWNSMYPSQPHTVANPTAAVSPVKPTSQQWCGYGYCRTSGTDGE
jgi:hypothetical protein